MSNATLMRELWRQSLTGLRAHIAVTAAAEAMPPGERRVERERERDRIGRVLAALLNRVEREAGPHVTIAIRQRLRHYRDAIRGDTDAR